MSENPDTPKPDGPHPLALAARTLFRELTEAGRPVAGVGMGEGRIYLRVSGPEHGAPEVFQGFPVSVLTDHDIRR